MQKHQQWLQNKTYEHHLNCLTKIKSSKRKFQIKSATPGKCHGHHTSHHHNPGQSSPKKSKSKNKSGQLPLKQKNLLWQNFLLGKRIIEASPVIVQKKHIDDYNRNRKILDLRTKITKRSQLNSHFRSSKLKQFTAKTFRINQQMRVETACRLRKILVFRFVFFSFHRMRILPFQEIFLKYKFETKKHWMKTEIVNFNGLFNYTFYFTLSKHKKQDKNMMIQLFEMRGLNQVQIGSFLLDVLGIRNNEEDVVQKSDFYRNGKLLGEVQYCCTIIKKKEIINENF